MEDISDLLVNVTSPTVEKCTEVLIAPTPKYYPLKVYTKDYGNMKTPKGNALIYVTGYFLDNCLLQHS